MDQRRGEVADGSSIAPDVLNAALETYRIVSSLGLSTEALREALSSALVVHERQVITRVADIAEELARQDGGPVGLHWFAARLRKDLHPLANAQKYTPGNGDLVEVILTGQVRVFDSECVNCHQPAGQPECWSVTDRRSGAEYHFLTAETDDLHVRVIMEGKPNGTG